MNRKHIIYGIVALLILGGGWVAMSFWRSRTQMREIHKPDFPKDVFRTQQNLDTFLSATMVTAERLHYRPNNFKANLDGYDHDMPLLLNADQVLLLQQTLGQESAYGSRYQSECAPNYGVLLTFRSGPSTVRFALCFQCGLLGVFDSEDDAAKEINTEKDFGPGLRKVLTGVVKELFPNDADIQKLK